MYKIVSEDGSLVQFVSNGIVTCTTIENPNYLTWLAEGNTPEPYIPPSIDYRDARAAEYPPITDYLDAIVKSDSEALNKYISDCNAVKQKYPKPDMKIETPKKSKRMLKGTK